MSAVMNVSVYCTGCGSSDLRYECKNCSDSTKSLRAKLNIAIKYLQDMDCDCAGEGVEMCLPHEALQLINQVGLSEVKK